MQWWHLQVPCNAAIVMGSPWGEPCSQHPPETFLWAEAAVPLCVFRQYCPCARVVLRPYLGGVAPLSRAGVLGYQRSLGLAVSDPWGLACQVPLGYGMASLGERYHFPLMQQHPSRNTDQGVYSECKLDGSKPVKAL